MTDHVDFFKNENWTAGVIGLGYVGLPLLVTASSKGLGGIGYDISKGRVRDLAEGRSHVDDVTDEELQSTLRAGVQFTTDPEALAKADAIFICVPSPLGRNRQPDLSYIESAAELVTRVARKGQLISLESTTYPGTTEDYLIPAVEKAGLSLDEDVWISFSPERVSPGDHLKTRDIPKVVGGVTAMSTELATAAYERIIPTVHPVSSARAAELSKLLENTYRAVNIGLVNEVAQLSHLLDIDIWEVVDAAATKPFGYQPFYPGPGVGGHCIPLDPQYLAWRAREAKFETRFIETAERVNSQMPEYTTQRIVDILNSMGKATRGSRILVIGIAYKPDVSDDRESASVDVANRLAKRGAEIFVFDPLVDETRVTDYGFTSVGPEALDGFDIAVVLTDHSGVPYKEIAEQAPMVFDTRGVYRRLGISASNVEAL